MRLLVSPLYSRDHLVSTLGGLHIAKHDPIHFEDIQETRVRPTWHPFFGVLYDISVVWRGGHERVFYNLSAPEMKRIREAIQNAMPSASMTIYPQFVSGKNLLIPDIVIPSKISIALIATAILVLLSIVALFRLAK